MLLGHDVSLSSARGQDTPRGRIRILVIGSDRDAGVVQSLPGSGLRPQPGAPVRANPAPTLADYLLGRGYLVNELSPGHRITAEELRGVNLVLCLGKLRPHTKAEIAAYTSFVEQGGSLLIEGGRPVPQSLSSGDQRLDGAFGVEIGEPLPGPGIVRWADHPITRGVPPLDVISSRLVPRSQASAIPLGSLQYADLRIPGALTVAAVFRGQGKVLFIGSAQPLTAITQPLTDRVLDWLTTREANRVSIGPVEIASKPAPPIPSVVRPPSAGELEAYRAAVDQAGPDSDAQVRLALWCEAHGLETERLRHLTLAVEADADHATARRLLVQIAAGDQWLTVDEVAQRARADAALVKALAEYNAKRQETPEKAEDQWRLALWCEQNGLDAESRAHLTVVTRLAPGRAEAWLRLGCKRYNGRWLTAEQIATEKVEAEAQRQADRIWQFRLESLARKYFGPESERSMRLEEASKVTDPRAVNAVWRVFARNKSNPKLQEGAVRLLEQIDSPLATQRIAVLAVFGKTAHVRNVAAEVLLRRDPRDFLDLLIPVLYPILEYRIRHSGDMERPSELLVEGERFNLKGIYIFQPAGVGGGRFGSGLRPGDDRSARLAEDIASIERHNNEVRRMNEPLLALLRNVTGQDPGSSREEWRAWWTDQKGYAYAPPPASSKPTLVQYFVTPRPTPTPLVGHSCFGAGTPVRTAAGLRPIEELRVGDRVLTQGTQTGALSFQPIVAVFHNPPNATLRVQIGEDAIVATGIHRFWKAGVGWVMARDLKTGDSIRTLDGRLGVVTVESGEVQPVFNLELSEGKSFFVGKQGALVHDNTLVDSVLHPFDTEPVLASTGIPKTP
jgi:hypothetical protein